MRKRGMPAFAGLLLLLVAAGSGCAANGAQGREHFGEGWTLERGQGVESITLPASVALGDSKRFTLEKRIAPELLAPGRDLILEFERGRVPFALSVNGVPVYRHGETEPGAYRVHIAAAPLVRIPYQMLRGDGSDEIELRCRYEGSLAPFPAVFRIDEARLRYLRLIETPFNTTLYVAFVAVSIFAGIVFLIQWGSERRAGSHAWFGLAALLFAIFFAEIGLPARLLPYHAFRLAAKLAIPLAGFALLAGTLALLAARRRAIPLAIQGTLALVASAYIASQGGDDIRLDAAFSYGVGTLVPAILASAIALVFAARRRVPGSLILLAGLALGAASGVHDAFYIFPGRMAPFWLVGPGFFAVVLAMFAATSVRGRAVRLELERSRAEIESRTRRLQVLNEAFARFIPTGFIELLGRDGVDEVELGDQAHAEMAVLVADIRDFTGLSESMKSSDVFGFLNGFFGRIVPAVREHGGLVDKFMGDAIMAIFPGGSSDALQAALEIRRIVSRYNTDRESWGWRAIDLGIGVHSGDLILGTIGETERMDTTVVSDAVNVTSRLQDLTKRFRVPVIVSGPALETCPDVRNRFAFRYLGQVRLKGKLATIPTYELVSEDVDPLAPEKIRHRGIFERAVFLLESGDLVGATGAFRESARRFPRDPALAWYVERFRRARRGVRLEDLLADEGG